MNDDVVRSPATKPTQLHGLMVARDIVRFPMAVEVITSLGRGVDLRERAAAGDLPSIEAALTHLQSRGIIERVTAQTGPPAASLTPRGRRLCEALAALDANEADASAQTERPPTTSPTVL